MNTARTQLVSREEAILVERGFQLVRAQDGTFVATETRVRGVPVTCPHETADEAWQAAYKRVIRAN